MTLCNFCDVIDINYIFYVICMIKIKMYMALIQEQVVDGSEIIQHTKSRDDFFLEKETDYYLLKGL